MLEGNKQGGTTYPLSAVLKGKEGETTHPLLAVLKGKQARWDYPPSIGSAQGKGRRDYPPSVGSAQGKTSKVRLPTLCRQCSRENKQGETTHPLSAVLEGKQARRDYPPSVGSLPVRGSQQDPHSPAGSLQGSHWGSASEGLYTNTSSSQLSACVHPLLTIMISFIKHPLSQEPIAL